MSARVFLPIFVLSLGFSSVATSEISECLTTKSPENQLQCGITQDFAKSEQLLNSTYNKVLTDLASRQEFGNERNFVLENMRSRLRISQRSWLYFRESQCELEAFGLLATQHTTATYIVCQTAANNARANELDTYFEKFKANSAKQ